MTVLPSHLCINHRQTQLHAGCQGMDLECLACLPLHRLMIDPDDFAWSQKRQALSMEWRTPLFLAHPTALPGSFVSHLLQEQCCMAAESAARGPACIMEQGMGQRAL